MSNPMDARYSRRATLGVVVGAGLAAAGVGSRAQAMDAGARPVRIVVPSPASEAAVVQTGGTSAG
jgi:hypothetical protein